jgi:hypothetical protein
MTMLFAGSNDPRTTIGTRLILCRGGTSGCVLAGRLAEDSNVSILLIEAGSDNAELESTRTSRQMFLFILQC